LGVNPFIILADLYSRYLTTLDFGKSESHSHSQSFRGLTERPSSPEQAASPPALPPSWSLFPPDIKQAAPFVRSLTVIGRLSLSDESLEQNLTLLGVCIDALCASFVSGK
jgi:hypothetical protein